MSISLLTCKPAWSYPGYAASLLTAKGSFVAGGGRARRAIWRGPGRQQRGLGDSPNNASKPTRTATGLPTLSLWAQTQRDCALLSPGVERYPGDLPAAAQYHGTTTAQCGPTPLAV